MSVAHPWLSCHTRTRGNTKGEASKKQREPLCHKLDAWFFQTRRDDNYSGDRGVQQGEAATRARTCARANVMAHHPLQSSIRYKMCATNPAGPGHICIKFHKLLLWMCLGLLWFRPNCILNETLNSVHSANSVSVGSRELLKLPSLLSQTEM